MGWIILLFSRSCYRSLLKHQSRSPCQLEQVLLLNYQLRLTSPFSVIYQQSQFLHKEFVIDHLLGASCSLGLHCHNNSHRCIIVMVCLRQVTMTDLYFVVKHLVILTYYAKLSCTHIQLFSIYKTKSLDHEIHLNVRCASLPSGDLPQMYNEEGLKTIPFGYLKTEFNSTGDLFSMFNKP